jgi:hypothetical protein
LYLFVLASTTSTSLKKQDYNVLCVHIFCMMTFSYKMAKKKHSI